MNKRAFSFVELIIVVSILALLAIIAYSANNTIKQNTINTRVTADLDTIKNSLISYKTDTGELPLPTGNLNNFKADSTYSHDGIDVTDTEAFGTFGKITPSTLPKKYLAAEITDPRTGNYYSYGITGDKQLFEIAGVVSKEDYFVAALSGTYRGDGGPISLIREYNGAKFIKDGAATLPYNPYEQVVTVTDQDGKVYDVNKEIVAPPGKDLTLYFSDGSISLLKAGSSITLKNTSLVKDNGLITKIELTLNAGTLWTKASRLFTDGGSEPVSSFEVATSDTTAAVRGTIFCFGSCPGGETVVVLKGEVKVTKKQEGSETTTEIVPANLDISIEEYFTNSDLKFANDASDSIKENTITTGNIPTQEAIEKDIEANTKDKNTQVVETIDTTNCIKLPDNDCYTEIRPITNTNGEKKEYQLVAYAPYDTPGDVNMYLAGGNKTTTASNENKVTHTNIKFTTSSQASSQNEDMEDINCIVKTPMQSHCKMHDASGIFIDSADNDGAGNDSLIYTNLQYGKDSNKSVFGDNFVIEMSVRGAALKRTGNFQLFKLGDISMYINDGKIYEKSGSGTGSSIDSESLIDDNFYPVTFINDVSSEIYINNSRIYSFTDSLSSGDNKLYIGSDILSGNYINQWNDIIEYVKIYVKQ